MRKRLKWFLSHQEETFAAILLAVMVSIAFINVLTRFGLNYSLAFTEELTVYLFVWMTLLGTSLAFREKSHMVVTALYSILPKSCKKLAYIAATFFCILFFVVLGYWGVVEVADEMLVKMRTESMHLPMWYFTVSIPIASCFIVFRILARALADLKSGDLDY